MRFNFFSSDLGIDLGSSNVLINVEGKGISIREPDRADGLHRILYKCPHCGAEGKTEGKGTRLTCHGCGKEWEMDEWGQMVALEGETVVGYVGSQTVLQEADMPRFFRWRRSTSILPEIFTL